MTMPAVRPLLPVLAGAMLVVSGCYVQSIRPLYDDKTVIFDNGLVGTWVATEDEEFVFTVNDTARGTYTLISDEGGATARFEAALVELGDVRFLDIYPSAPESENTFYLDHLLRVHNIIRVEMESDTLWASDFDAEWVQTMVEQKKVRVPNVTLDGATLLTGTTSELQAFVRKYAKTPEAFSEPAKFVRSD